MKKMLVNLICCFIFNKNKRHNFRKKFMNVKEFKNFSSINELTKDLEDTKEIFTQIFNENYWGDDESVSGPGSKLENTKNLRKELPKIIKKYGIKSILDVPCGDMNWMSKVDLSNIKYYGFDIVEELIKNNSLKFSNNKNYIFQVVDAIGDKLPCVDLIICRDLIIHFPLEAIYQLLNNFIKSGSKYLLITETKGIDENLEISFGSWTYRNLRKPPFNLPESLVFIRDHEAQSNNCGMAFYRLKDIKKYI